MKKSIIYSLAVLFFMASCRKSDNPKIPTLTQVPMPVVLLDASTPITTLPLVNTDAFSAKINIDNYFKTGPLPSKFDIVVQKNGNPATVKMLQANVTTFPTTITVTGLQLRTLFGTAILGGDSFTVGADVYTQDGTKYPAFLPLVNGVQPVAYTPLDSKLPNSGTSVTFKAPAPFIVAAYGAFGAPTPYKVVRDDWADYQPGDVIPVTVIDATHISFFYATDVSRNPIVITVDPVSNVTSAALQNFGGYSSLPSYGTWTAVSIPDLANNIVSPESVTISVNLDLASTTKGDFGSNIIVLTKK